MKHAICLLAYKDKEYVHQFIDQFENHSDIEFYIHWHNHDTDECEELMKYSPNIKIVINNFNSRRFSIDLVLAELSLYSIAMLNPEIGMCHLYSECDYIICPVQYFIDYYNARMDCNFVDYIIDNAGANVQVTLDHKHKVYKASQWKSLNVATINKLFEEKEFLVDLINIIGAKSRYTLRGASDEFIIPTILKCRCDVDKNLEHNMHYVNWTQSYSHPNTLSLSLSENPSYDINYDDILANIAIRKIDICNDESKEFLHVIRQKFLEKHNQ